MIIAYKGFEPNLTCRGFQYELGKTYSLPERPKLCKQGFHACLLPIDAIRYYPYDSSVYTKVKLSECDSSKDLYDFAFDTKICGRRIWVSTRMICIEELIYETFRLLDQLAVYADLGGALPSEYYYSTTTYISQIKNAALVLDTRIDKAIRFAHFALGFIIDKLIDSQKIFYAKDFIRIVTELQQTKEEEHATDM